MGGVLVGDVMRDDDEHVAAEAADEVVGMQRRGEPPGELGRRQLARAGEAGDLDEQHRGRQPAGGELLARACRWRGA